MMNDEFGDTHPSDVPPDVEFPNDDDQLRYAPVPELATGDDADPVEVFATAGTDKADDAPTGDEWGQPAAVALPDMDDMDIEGALAAVASLSDVLAEQEAAEQARLAQAEASARATAERQARLESPELFFPMPPATTLQRGNFASVVPALLLILMGVWLTFTLTTSQTPLDSGLVAAVAAGALAVILFVQWLSSGRWARGALLFALLLLLAGITLIYLLQPTAPGLLRGWPLMVVAAGAAFLLSGLLAQPVDRRVVFPALALVFAGLVALAVTMEAISSTLLLTAASAWPVVLVVVVAIWLLPALFRQRQ